MVAGTNAPVTGCEVVLPGPVVDTVAICPAGTAASGGGYRASTFINFGPISGTFEFPREAAVYSDEATMGSTGWHVSSDMPESSVNSTVTMVVTAQCVPVS
jgi:hypothetical protein